MRAASCFMARDATARASRQEPAGMALGQNSRATWASCWAGRARCPWGVTVTMVSKRGPSTCSSPRLSLSANTPMMATFRWGTNSSRAWRRAWEQPGLWPPSSSTRGDWEMTSIRAGMKALSNPRAMPWGVTGQPRLWSTSSTFRAVTAFFTWCSPRKGVRRASRPQGAVSAVKAVPDRERSPSRT